METVGRWVCIMRTIIRYPSISFGMLRKTVTVSQIPSQEYREVYDDRVDRSGGGWNQTGYVGRSYRRAADVERKL